MMSTPLDVGALSAVDRWVRPKLFEQTGPSLFVARQSWILRWNITPKQQLQLKNFVETSLFKGLLDQVLLSPNIKEVDSRSVYERYCDAFFSFDGSTNECASLNIIRCVVLACKDTLDLEEISLYASSESDGQSIAFCSSRHIVCGAFLLWIKELLWFLVCKSEGLTLPHLTYKQLQSRCNIWQGWNNKINSDWLLSSMLLGAKSRNLHAMPVDLWAGIWQIGIGANSRMVRHSSNDLDSHLGVVIAQNKRSSSKLLKKIGCNVPREMTISTKNLSVEYLREVASKIGFPCVVKPVDTDGGIYVTADIKNTVELSEAIALIRSAKKQQALLQEHVSGDDYRLFVMNYRLTSVVKRVIPHLVGDGVSTLHELLLNENKRREDLRKNNFYASPLDEKDIVTLANLRKSGFEWGDVLKANVRINLRSNANVKTGGMRFVVPLDDVHESLKRQCEAIAHSFRLSVCGLDYISEDLQRDLSALPHSGSFIEVNAVPDCPPERSEIILQGLESYSELNLDVHVCVVDLGSAVPREMVKRIEILFKKNVNAVIAVKKSCLPAIVNLLPPDSAYHVNGYDHVHDPLLNRGAELFIYCISPEDLIQNGLPVGNVKTLDIFCPKQPMSILRDLERLKKFVDG